MRHGRLTRVKAVKTIHRTTGSAWPGDKGLIVDVTGDGYKIKWEKGDWIGDVIKDDDVTSA